MLLKHPVIVNVKKRPGASLALNNMFLIQLVEIFKINLKLAFSLANFMEEASVSQFAIDQSWLFCF